MVKRTKKQKVWNNYKRKLYGKAKKRETTHNSSGINQPSNSRHDFGSWLSPMNFGGGTNI